MGAAGRDFHNFNMRFRNDAGSEIVAFTAAQIPFIGDRLYPPALSGPLYPEGIRIFLEDELPRLITDLKADEVVFSYSDLSHEDVMHRASLVVSLGADFRFLGAETTMLASIRPVISVCAVRTGSGKSGVTRFIARVLKERGKRPVVIRHPMPYGDLAAQRAQRFSSYDDMRRADCTIEEMEEYEPLVSDGVTVFAGVDYAEILSNAEKEADVIIWDGGNNDLPFIRPDLEIVVADPLRPGHESSYFPGEANARRADCLVINKADSAEVEAVKTVEANLSALNPTAKIIKTASVVKADPSIAGKSVLVIEDGPTLTHGGMDFGAGVYAARTFGAHPIDVRPYAVGSIKETLKKYPRLTTLLPAMGYSKGQVRDLEETVNNTPCDLVLIATPIDLSRVINIRKPFTRVEYEVKDMEKDGLASVVAGFIERV
ncbi:MAG: GTPase [Deltaproteobacteria bacterium]|nr:GTPase [Deltaproteobacteria bacterium]